MQYLKTPSALFDSLSTLFLVASLSLLAILIFFWIKFYQKWVGGVENLPHKRRRSWAFVLLPLLIFGVGVAIRGGFGVMPINESAVYFSKNITENHAATNPTWHLIHSLVEARAEHNPFNFNDLSESRRILDSLQNQNVGQHLAPIFEYSDSLPSPNVVLVVMESMTAQVIESLGGAAGICPNLERLASEGVSFQNIFSSGYRTDQGLVAVLSGYPALPDQSVILLEDKMRQLPSLPRVFAQNGYQTAFFYGGETTFANMGLYLHHLGFGKILSEKDFPANQKTQRWGVDDSLFLLRVHRELDALPQPFFATALTLSLHPPFDAGTAHLPATASDGEKFVAAARFTDRAIGNFLQLAEKSDWLDNTLFVFVADHGAKKLAPPPQPNHSLECHIPLIFWQKNFPKKIKGLKINCLGNHFDFPATFLAAGLPQFSNAFSSKWSKNLWQSGAGQFAYFSNENGMGWLTNEGEYFFEFQHRKWRGNLGAATDRSAKSFLQVLYQDFLELDANTK